MDFFEIYNNCPIDTIFYQGSDEYRLVRKEVKMFNELRLTFKRGFHKPIYLTIDEFDYESQEWLLSLRLIKKGIEI
jgi:hypothetical protein